MKGANRALLLLLAVIGLLIAETRAAKMGETCLLDRNCDAGLHCETCVADGGIRPRCTRVKPTDPQSKGKGLPFNRYSWLTTHNSFARLGQRSATGSVVLAPTNQQDTITAQLNNGVRGLMLDMYDFENDIWLCHSFGGVCYNITSFEPAINVLKEIQAFLEANPTEIITIFIEDYVKTPAGLTNVFNAAELRKYWFPVSRMPKNGEDWPLISDMISRNQRLLVFTSKSAKEASEGIAYEWRYVVENQCTWEGWDEGRVMSQPGGVAAHEHDDKIAGSDELLPDAPNLVTACRDNSAPLVSMLNTCHDLSGSRWPNFVAVDFYKRSDGAGAPGAVDIANGLLVCGCNNIANCKVNAAFGSCDISPKAVTNTDASSPVGGPRSPSGASSAGVVSIWRQVCMVVSLVIVDLLI